MVKTNPIPINAKTIIQPVEKFCNLPNILPSISTDAHFYTYDRFLLISSGSIDRTNLYEGHLETSEQQSTNITNFENLKKNTYFIDTFTCAVFQKYFIDVSV